MAAVEKLPEPPEGSAAAHYLQKVIASKPNDGFMPGAWGGMPGGADIPRPNRPYTHLAIGPDDWPLVSESGWETAVADARRILGVHRDSHATAIAIINSVFDHNGPWPAGEGAKQAAAFHDRQNGMHSQLIGALEAIVDTATPLSGDIRSTKRQMRELDDQMHQDIETHLRNHPGGNTPLNIAAIAAPYRTRVEELRTELQGYFGAATTALGNKVPLAPAPGKTDDPHKADSDDGSRTAPGDKAITDDPHKATSTAKPTPNGTPTDNFYATSTPAPLSPVQTPLGAPVTTGHASGMGSSFMPSSLPTGAGAGAPGTPPLSGLLGAGMFPPSSLNSAVPSTPPATPPLSVAADRGFAAGLAASGGAPVIPPTVPPPAPAAVTPLAASPATVTSPAAAPVTTPQVSASTAAVPAAAPVTPDATQQPMASYGSVLPPTAGAPTGTPGASPSVPNVPATGSGGVSGGTTGLVPVTVRESGRIEHDGTERDIELARRAVAELAGPASISAAGTDWAVAVSYTRQRRQTLWVATNDGATYLPAGVYLRRDIHIAAVDPDFNARWAGWWCPAETAVRAAIESGDDVTAVATTQMRWPDRPSELLDAVELDVQYGVAHGGLHTEASELTGHRIHRLQTLGSDAWRLHDEVAAASKSRSWELCRAITDRVAYSLEGELSPNAKVVADQLLASRAPTGQQWAELRSEFDYARIQEAGQRPGLDGIERPEQTASYRQAFVAARKLEALICWGATPWDASDVVYAALAAGVPVTGEWLLAVVRPQV